MKRILQLLTLIALTSAMLVPTAGSASAWHCQRGWGSLAKSAGSHSTNHLVNVRAGRHACFDRLVLDTDGPVSGYRVRYVQAVHADGSGQHVPLRGGAKLEVILLAPAYNDQGQPTYRPANRSELVNVSGYRTFRQVAPAGSFEGQTTIGLGVRARLPYRVFTVRTATGHHTVIDVAHRW